MTREEFDERLEKLDAIFAKYETVFSQCKAEIKELRNAQIEDELPTPPHPKWKPAHMERYYIVWCNGAIEETYWAGNESDNNEYSTGNVFRTKAEAEFAVERMRVLAEMREWAWHRHDGAYIYYHKPGDAVLTGWSEDSDHCYGDIYFKSLIDAENCIKAVGKERLMRYYFMLPDNEEE